MPEGFLKTQLIPASKSNLKFSSQFPNKIINAVRSVSSFNLIT